MAMYTFAGVQRPGLWAGMVRSWLSTRDGERWTGIQEQGPFRSRVAARLLPGRRLKDGPGLAEATRQAGDQGCLWGGGEGI